MRRMAFVAVIFALTVLPISIAKAQGTPREAPNSLDAREMDYPVARPDVTLSFPRDHGAHPDFRTEWWYVTGWLTIEEGPRAGEELGFQVTFFRTRPRSDPANPSRFNPSQILFAHAALSDPAVGRLLHGEASAREGFGIAQASTSDANVVLRDWTFERRSDGTFTSRVETPDFSLSLTFDPTQSVFAQGKNGYSRKGPKPEDASIYYSLPHLDVSGTLGRDDGETRVTGEAWLDREWSSNYLAPGAVGWDWTGLNFDDGGAMVAFRIRGADGGTFWAGGSYRNPDGKITRFEPSQVSFETVRSWTSPHTDAAYPVEQVLTVELPSGPTSFPLKPMFDDQELDGRGGGMPVYWEGAVETTGGRGYLELTGYASDLEM